MSLATATVDGATIERLPAWARVESPTDAPEAVNRMMDLVVADVAGAPVAVERVPGRDGLGDTLILRAGPQRDTPCLLVLSHLDTVHPIGTLDRDLPVRLEGDRLYGPGVYLGLKWSSQHPPELIVTRRRVPRRVFAIRASCVVCH